MVKKTYIYIVIIFFTLLIISISNLDLKPKSFQTTIDILLTLGNAAIGGLVAYYAAYIQVQNSKNMEDLKQLKTFKNICILVKNDLRNINKRMEVFTKKDVITYGEIKDYIVSDSLEKFKYEFIYMIKDEEDVSLLSKILNRLLLLKMEEKDKKIDKDRINKLIIDIEEFERKVGLYLEDTNRKINSKFKRH
ncbi:hypothetical protein BN988_01610 [Oceanobacillus picturae]|uniref:Uncharacterized protein n=1 Tax=Oceanobacillus picturae TaxID=171693 RepID=W9B9D5_9BACI|nr:hypothetical protein BN988_01610 [Oceanobacillus picturae]